MNPSERIQDLREFIENEGVDPSDRSIAKDTREFAENATGRFRSDDVYRFLHLSTKNDRKACLAELGRLCGKGVLERVPGVNGVYRPVAQNFEVLDFFNAPDDPLPIQIPMGIHDDLGVKIYEKDLIGVAGVSSHGKSGFMLAFAAMNMEEHDVWYLSHGDMSATRLKDRMKNSGIALDTWQKYLGGKALEVYGPFEDYVRPTALNLCDFMHDGEKPWMIAEKMKAVKDKLTTGIAVIAIQKNRGAEYGLGKEKSEIYTNLYITIDSGVARIKKAKSFFEEKGSPVGKKYEFKLVRGFEFIPDKSGVGQWYHPSDIEDAGIKTKSWR